MADATAGGAPLPAIAAALRRERGRVGMSQAELARSARIAKSTLSQLESGLGNPSVETLWALGIALGVPFSRLVDPPRTPVRLVRVGDGAVYLATKADYTANLLSSSPPGARRDIYRISADPGRARESEPHHPGTVEHVVLMTGRAVVGPADDPVELAVGDYLSYPGDIPHVFRALEPGSSAVIVMEHN